MQDYSIDTLYDEGYINGEVYYLCDENGISCLADAIKFFEDHNSTNVNLQHELDVNGCVYYGWR